MTDDELAKHLRNLGMHSAVVVADRIEALTAEYEEAMECNEQFFVDNEFLKKRVEAQAEWRKYEGAWMTAEGMLADAECNITHLHKLLAEAASDLTAYVDAEYPPDTCAQYPDIANRRERDMELVRRIAAELKGESHE